MAPPKPKPKGADNASRLLMSYMYGGTDRDAMLGRLIAASGLSGARRPEDTIKTAAVAAPGTPGNPRAPPTGVPGPPGTKEGLPLGGLNLLQAQALDAFRKRKARSLIGGAQRTL